MRKNNEQGKKKKRLERGKQKERQRKHGRGGVPVLVWKQEGFDCTTPPVGEPQHCSSLRTSNLASCTDLITGSGEAGARERGYVIEDIGAVSLGPGCPPLASASNS